MPILGTIDGRGLKIPLFRPYLGVLFGGICEHGSGIGTHNAPPWSQVPREGISNGSILHHTMHNNDGYYTQYIHLYLGVLIVGHPLSLST